MVLVVLEGGLNTIRTVLESVTSTPARVPVVIADGSGRAADILAYAYSLHKANEWFVFLLIMFFLFMSRRHGSCVKRSLLDCTFTQTRFLCYQNFYKAWIYLEIIPLKIWWRSCFQNLNTMSFFEGGII